MFRDRVLGKTIIALLLTSLACNAFAGSPEPFPPPPTPIAEKGEGTGTTDLAATALVPALSPVVSARVTVLVDLNVRSGPGVQYDRVGFLLKNETVPVIGINPSTGWWKISCPNTVADSECWVSGGEQYTQPEFVEGVAEIDAPATPTPIPPTLEEGLGILAYVDQGVLFATKLSFSHSLPQPASEPLQLTDVEDVQSFAISPDGRRIAFISGSKKTNSLYVVNTDGKDLRLLVDAADSRLAADLDHLDFVVLVDRIAWLSDNTSLAFNTAVVDREGLGMVSHEDLWTATLDGQLTEVLPAGSGGGAFAFTANNKVLLSRSDNIARADTDGSYNEIVLNFEPVNRAGENLFYPHIQFAEKGQMYVYIPAIEPVQPGALTTLWRIPVAGPARELGSIEDVATFAPILWSPDGNRLTFVQYPADPDPQAISKVFIADEKGINPNPYAGGKELTVHGWAADSNKFLYSGEGFYAVGRINGPPVQILLSSGQQVGDAQWVTDESFVLAIGSSAAGSWALSSSSLSGDNIPMADLRGIQPLFEIWQPQE